MRRALIPALALLVFATIRCSEIPPDPLQLNRSMLTVDNRTKDDWTGVEIWLNQYFRITVPKIAAGSRFQAPLSTFVSGYAQRFDASRLPVRDVRLTAKRPDGTTVELRRGAEKGGLAALGEKGHQ